MYPIFHFPAMKISGRQTIISAWFVRFCLYAAVGISYGEIMLDVVSMVPEHVRRTSDH